MTIEGLSFVNSVLNELNIPFEYMEWTSSPIPKTYWTTEYMEVEQMNEDGMEETSFILTGTTKGKFIELEKTKENIKKKLGCYGHTGILNSGSTIVIMYSDSYPIPSVDFGVKRLQINLIVKEWRC